MKAYGSFDEAVLNDPTVHAAVAAGAQAEMSDVDMLKLCVLALANQKNAALRAVERLSLIAPRRYKLPDGRMMVYRVPIADVPVTSLQPLGPP